MKIELKDNVDLMLVYSALNFIQAKARHDLVINRTNIENLELKWIDETVEEFDRLQTIKIQILELLKKNQGGIKDARNNRN